MSWAPEVQTGADLIEWYGNALRFATKEEAEANAEALMMRWTAVHATRAVESPDSVNYKWVDGGLIRVGE